MVRFFEPVKFILLLTWPLLTFSQADTEDPFGLNDSPVITAKDKTTEALASDARSSLVVVTQQGRGGAVSGTGTGFVISEDGLIATCAHVIGESRPITIRFDNGKEHEVTEIHAWDRKLDLAILRIEAKGLNPLPLARTEAAKQGTEVIAMGNPHGLEFSVVRGVVSGLREIDGLSLIQIAIPIEPGNSGGPLMDTKGNVHGLLNMKSAITDNLGFAIPITNLLKLLDKPNKVAMNKWLTIGQLNPAHWQPIMGARWQQRAGRITVTKPGTGFGGRSLCIYQKTVPEPPYEVKVEVKLDDETGAAGLIFESNGGEKHYGFYPSEGNLRLTKFEGPDVLSWSIIEQISTGSYRSGEWNRIRVRVGEKNIIGFVNGKQLFEIEDSALRGGKVGLAKFRSTEAQFKHFQVGKDLAQTATPDEVITRLTKQVDTLTTNPSDHEAIETLENDAGVSQLLLQRKIKELKASAEALERIADHVHHANIERKLLTELKKGDDSDLTLCALLLAKYDNPELDIAAYHGEVERMALELSRKLKPEDSEKHKIEVIAKYLFEDNGYHGSRTDYYNRSNSYLNEVIDDREGIPITLSILFIELSSRLNANLKGLGLPGHFVVFYKNGKERQIIDPFNNGKPMSTEEADRIVQDYSGTGKADEYPAADNRTIIQRMIYNLKSISIESNEYKDAVRYVDLLLALDPDDAQERLSRALLNIQSDQGEKAKSDLEWLFEKKPEGIHLQRLRELYDRL